MLLWPHEAQSLDVCNTIFTIVTINIIQKHTGFPSTMEFLFFFVFRPHMHFRSTNMLIMRFFGIHIFAAAGHPNCVFKITYNELIKITNGSEKEISE